MNTRKKQISLWLFGIAGMVIIFGILISVCLFLNTSLGMYPGLIADAYREEQHHLIVPGSIDITLNRTGSYGIYYEHSLVPAAIEHRTKMPPALDCSLTSQSNGAKIKGVPDYVETNRYWSKDQGRSGVLIMSITVDNPDSYTFNCVYQDGSTDPEIVVALGPNYFWEFIKVAWKITLPLIGGFSVICLSALIAVLFIIAGIILAIVSTTQKPDPS